MTRTGVALVCASLLLSSWSSVAEEPRVVTGEAPPALIASLLHQPDFDIPAVLYFDSGGCLVWSGSGSEVDFARELRARLAIKNSCDVAAWPEAVESFESLGLPVSAEMIAERPILIWYGSDSLCEPCRTAKEKAWPTLVQLAPSDTIKMLLELPL